MTKEEIITTVIHEVFMCGKEAGKEHQRMLSVMSKKVEYAMQGETGINPYAYSGLFNQMHRSNVDVDTDGPDTDSEEVRLQAQAQANELEQLKAENKELVKILEEKDATITELRNELEQHIGSNKILKKKIVETDL